jgi:hypothetical protein
MKKITFSFDVLPFETGVELHGMKDKKPALSEEQKELLEQLNRRLEKLKRLSEE